MFRFLYVFETGSCCVVQGDLKLTKQSPTSDTWCFCLGLLLSAGFQICTVMPGLCVLYVVFIFSKQGLIRA